MREGGGVGWAVNPIPNNGHAGSTCDDWTGHACTIGCPTEPTLEAAAAAGKTAPGCPGATYDASATAALFPNQLSKDGSGELGKNVAIQDVLRVPRVPAGEYVVGFRWCAYASAYLLDLTVRSDESGSAVMSCYEHAQGL